MSHKIPAEIFHRILWDFLLRPEMTQGLLPERYHLQEDRQVCVYTLSDFQNARLVCRLWNKWLLNDFDVWRHLCIRSAKNSLVAKDAISRFPAHPFEIRVLVDPDPYADSDFGDEFDSDSMAGGTEVDFDSDVSLSAVDEDDATDEGNESIASNPPEENNASPEPQVLPSPEDPSDLDVDYVGEEGDSGNGYDFFAQFHKNEIDHSWISEALDLVTPIIPHCRGLFLHLPTQMIHTALEKWADLGAPTLTRCAFEAIDYDGRTSKDVRRYRSAADPRKLKPPPPPLHPFLQKSSDLHSILIMNYYVPTVSHSDLGLDWTRLREFAMVYDRQDGPLIGPMEEDVLRSLILPASENECQSLTLNLAIHGFNFNAYHFHLEARLENLTLRLACFGFGYPIPEEYSQTECHIKRFTLSDGPLLIGRHRGIPKEADVLQHILEEMPKLESLSLIRVPIVCPIRRHTDEPDANMGPYVPPSISLPQFTTLFLEDSVVPSKSVIALIKRTPNLEHLTLTSKRLINIRPIIEALRIVSRGSSTVPCPQLRWLRILHSSDELRDFPVPYFQIVAQVENLEAKRDDWLAKGRCVPFRVERISLEEFRKKYYACSVI
ncbi:hypothetical protein SISNIDRAFT_489631 [Sistotremastrum niveocremeum HHB9708]|uniref:F-box domain-containing protein n=1 Tax=Sistotremastrum niveocremeum HHB9708 TaxID=1314777 RepID=A0A164PRL7_9AGAM|nr:hypothetical protein SISNIDRAFT_489631 [Sistotremastrum niveocremeum HHB9708]